MRSWSHEDIFSNEPVQPMIVASAKNKAYVGTGCTNPFHYKKFISSETVVYRKGQSIVGNADSIAINHHLHFNTLEALDFHDKCGHGINLADNPIILV